jgi:hypothetical protein
MTESSLNQFIERILPCMTKGGMTQIVSQGNGFRQILVELKGF